MVEKRWGKRRFFKRHLEEFFKESIIKNKKILAIGYEEDSSLLNVLCPSLGVELVNSCQEIKKEYPNIEFLESTFLNFQSQHKFDYIIFQDYLNYEDKLHEVFVKLKSLSHNDSKIFIFGVNPCSLSVIRFLKYIGVFTPKTERNILHLEDLENLLNICGFDILDKGYRFFSPFKLFGLGDLINAVIQRFPILKFLCFGQFVVFRPLSNQSRIKRLSASVVVPCHNEEGNIEKCIEAIPKFGKWREIIVVDDGSTDKTAEIAKRISGKRDDVKFISYGKNCGKGYAVNEGWKRSKGDVFMMLDCDMTTPPEELSLFHSAMEAGAEFVNGTRIVYPREKNSIPFLNRIGVTFFATLISWITSRRISDTFCGTKVFLKEHWHCFAIKEFLWGDWDLFFTATRYRMKMVELPVHYKSRKSGATKMKPFKHGIALLKASLKGIEVIK